MNMHEITDFESESCDSVEEDDDVEEDVENVLNFWNKVTKELDSCFKKNVVSEDFCDDIYENRFSIPSSGCYSYYADILAVAQMRDGRNTDVNSKKDSDQKNALGNKAIYPCTWKCTGQGNPAVGTGPFEELFQVLNWSEFSRLQNTDCSTTYSSQHCAPNPCLPPTYDEDFISYDSIENDYSPFTDMFYRCWNNDSFASLPATNNNDFVSQGFPAFE